MRRERKCRPDARVQALLARHGGDDPAALIARLCADLLDQAEQTAPVNLDVLASYRNAKVKVLDQEQAESVAWDSRHFVIRIRRADTEGRQRFSCGHGIVHTYFMECDSQGSDGSVVDTSWSQLEEELCDQGAAELLLPRAPFVRACPTRPTMDDVLALAKQFNASAEATALRVVNLSETPAALVVLEPRLKPAELKKIERSRYQPPLPGMEPTDTITPRLRVQKSIGHETVGYIPRHKSVDEATPLADVLTDDGIDYVGETGLIPGRFRVSARRLPIRRHGVLVDRIVMLLFDPEAERDPRRTRRSG